MEKDAKTADQLVETLEKKQKTAPLERNELVQLLLTPLMSGSMSQKERVGKSLELLHKERIRLREEDSRRMEAVLYAFALKFLNVTELKEIKEVMRMSPLGQMLREDGILEGVQTGIKTGRAETITLVNYMIRDGLNAELSRLSDAAFYAEMRKHYHLDGSN